MGGGGVDFNNEFAKLSLAKFFTVHSTNAFLCFLIFVICPVIGSVAMRIISIFLGSWISEYIQNTDASETLAWANIILLDSCIMTLARDCIH